MVTKPSWRSPWRCTASCTYTGSTFRVWAAYGTIYSLLGPRSEWAGYLQSLPQKTVPIGLFWGYKYSDDEIPEREAIDWEDNHELAQFFVNPETGVERLARVLDLGGVRVPLMLFGDCRPRSVDSTKEWWNRFYSRHQRRWI